MATEERLVGGIYGIGRDHIRTGWTMNVSPKAVALIFEPNYWGRSGDAEHNIEEVCEALGRCLRTVLKSAQEGK